MLMNESSIMNQFQHAAARRRLVKPINTQPPEGGCGQTGRIADAQVCFNTQPPEGGCTAISDFYRQYEFQHTAA